METFRYITNGANQIQCIDADASGACNASETLWEYDRAGNLLTDGSTQYTYDAANRLASITTASGTTTYAYNGDNDRISQSVNGTLTTYVLDTATPLTMVLAETTSAETVRYWHALDTLAQSDGTTTEYFGYDGLGSVRQLVDETGSVTLAQTFDPYGSGYATSGSASSSLGWTGEQTDSNGFVFLRARYYQPSMGRFTQMDPSRQERNAYLYAAGNPTMFVDLSGLRWFYKGSNEYEVAVVEWYMVHEGLSPDGGEWLHGGFDIFENSGGAAHRAASMGNPLGFKQPQDFKNEIDLLDIRNGSIWEMTVIKHNDMPLNAGTNWDERVATSEQAYDRLTQLRFVAGRNLLCGYFTNGIFDNASYQSDYYDWNNVPFELYDTFPTGSFDSTLSILEHHM